MPSEWHKMRWAVKDSLRWGDRQPPGRETVQAGAGLLAIKKQSEQDKSPDQGSSWPYDA
jgi:hypothetical protein